MKKITLGILLSICIAFAQNNSFKNISLQEAYNMQQKGVVLVDVRTKGEFDELHPKDAVNVPVVLKLGKMDQSAFNKDFVKDVLATVGNDKNKEVVLICRSGGRSKMAANILLENGFTNVYHIPQGVASGWFRENLPTEK